MRAGADQRLLRTVTKFQARAAPIAEYLLPLGPGQMASTSRQIFWLCALG